MAASEGAISVTANPGGGIVITVTQAISIPLTASPQGISGNATVYFNLEDVYAGTAASVLTVTPGNYAGGFHASIDGIEATAYSTSGRRTNESGIRDTGDLYVAFVFPDTITTKGAGDFFVLSPGSIVLSGVNAPPVPDFAVTTIQLGGITGNTTLSDPLTVPEPSILLACLAGLAGAGLRPRRR